MVQDRKEYILQKAFEVFMAKGYDSASMTVLQQELKMSRGAMYRYFESKEDLFIAVVDKYIFGLVDFIRPNFSDDMTMKERIEAAYQTLKNVCLHFDKIEGIEVVFLNFTALLVQAGKYYPGFIERMKVIKNTELKNWQRAIENSLAKGEIRSDVNVKMLALIFMRTADLNDADKPEPNFQKAAENTKKLMDYMYSLVKI